MRLRASGLVIAATVLAAMTSCSPASSVSQGSSSLLSNEDVQISDEQRAALEDNEVTREEYEAGFRRFQGCMDSKGYPLEEPTEVNEVYTFNFPAEAQDTAYLDCYPLEFQYVDAGWQTRPDVLEKSETSRMVKACLEHLGIEPADTHMERVDQFMTLDISLEEC